MLEGKEDGIHVMYKNETFWATQKAMAQLFDCSTDNIGLHLKNIFASGELDKDSVTEKNSATAADGKKYQTMFYNLDAIISVGYRVNSVRATQFRQWCTFVLRQFAIRGYVLDHKRMENGTFNPPSLPYGYMRRKQDIVTIENEAKIVRDIFTQYINGIGMETIAKELNKKHIDKGSKGFIWCKNTIRYILINEKYTGRSVFRKFYTTDNFPFKQKENKGEFDQYLVQETMPVIISEDIFEKAQHLISIRKSMGCRETAKYPLSGKIKCGNCGSSFRRKKINNTVCWTCSKHNINAADCELKAIPQDLIYSIFIGLCNKLFCNYKTILKPLQTSLQDLKLKEITGKTQVMDIHKEIAKFREQTHILARLKTKGFLDEAKYIEQTNELNVKISKLQSELKKLTRSDDEDEALDQIEMLTDFFEKREKPMTEFEELEFESIVDKIVVKNQHELEFHLIGGLKFKEKV